MKSQPERIAILGGGVSGLILAQELALKGVKITVLEKSSHLGGLQQSVEAGGLCFDIGSFLFASNHELLVSFPFLLEHFVEGKVTLKSIAPGGYVDHYPLTLRGFIKGHSFPQLAWGAFSLFYGRWHYRNPKNAGEYARAAMGSYIYKYSGLQNYMERIYGLPDHEIGLEFAEQRLGQIKRYTAFRLLKQEGMRLWKRNRAVPISGKSRDIPTLSRPRAGFALVYEMISRHLQKLGVEIRLAQEITRVGKTSDGLFSVETASEKENFDQVISTIPVPVMLKLCGEVPRERFETMSLYSLFYRGKLRIATTALFNFTLEGKWKRMHVFSNFYGQVESEDYFVIEITGRDMSPKAQIKMREDFELHAVRLKLVHGGLKFQGDQVTPNAYPVFRQGDAERLESEKQRLKDLGIFLSGRQGNFEYLFSHHAALKAKKLAESVLDPTKL